MLSEDILHFISNHCLLGKCPLVNRDYRVRASVLKDEFVKQKGYKISPQVLYSAMMNLFPQVVRSNVGSNNVYVGITLIKKVEITPPRYTGDDPKEAHRLAQQRYRLSKSNERPVVQSQQAPVVSVVSITQSRHPVSERIIPTTGCATIIPHTSPIQPVQLGPRSVKTTCVNEVPNTIVEPSNRCTLKVPLFKWNGTHLGNISNDSITNIFTSTRGEIYCRITHMGYTAFAVIKETKSWDPNILDEIKPIFGLPKIGTHSAIINGRNHLLKYALTNQAGQFIIDEQRLCEVEKADLSPELMDQVRVTYIFREIFAVTASNDYNLLIRPSPKGPYVLSYVETVMYPEKKDNSLSMPVIARWFDNTSPCEVLIQYLGVTRSNVTEKLGQLMLEINNVIDRVDRHNREGHSSVSDRLLNLFMMGLCSANNFSAFKESLSSQRTIGSVTI